VNKDGPIGIGQRVLSLMSRRERRRSLIMLASILLNSVIELLGLAAIIPVIGLAVNPNFIHRYEWLHQGYLTSASIGVGTEQQFLILLCALLMAVFLVKVGSALVIALFQNKFSFEVAHRLSGVMWTYHFSQSLQDMRASDSGLIMESIRTWPVAFANQFLVGSIRVLTEVVIIMGIGIGLLAYNFVISIAVLALLLVGVVMIRFLTRSKLQAYGQLEKRVAPKTNAMVGNATRGFLEIITFGAVVPVRDEYLRLTKSLYAVRMKSAVFFTLPSKTYELLAACAVCGAIILGLSVQVAGEEFFELLSLLAISAYRIMPSMSRVNSAAMAMRKDLFVLEALEEAVCFDKAARLQVVDQEGIEAAEVAVSLCGIQLGYAGQESPVIQGLDFHFRPGEISAIVGASGCGKSTLANSILGLHAPDFGQIMVDCGAGRLDLYADLGVDQWLSCVSYLSQAPFFFRGTVSENFTFGNSEVNLNEAWINELVDKLGLRATLGDNPLTFELNEGGQNLSGGQQQRLALLRAIQADCPLLLLDESTSALDKDARDLVFDVLLEEVSKGKLIILITHDLDLAQRCDHTLHLNQV